MPFPQNHKQRRWVDHQQPPQGKGGLRSGQVHPGGALPHLQHPEHCRVLLGHHAAGEPPGLPLHHLLLFLNRLGHLAQWVTVWAPTRPHTTLGRTAGLPQGKTRGPARGRPRQPPCRRTLLKGDWARKYDWSPPQSCVSYSKSMTCPLENRSVALSPTC